jgi:hypothetical protein
VRWPAVAALRAAPQFGNAQLKLYFFISDHIFSLHISCFSSTTGSLLHLNVHHLQKIYKKKKPTFFLTDQNGEHQLL